ncbi:MAG TPA: M14 family metallopeptidase [Thermoanaerobaculia bacterium]|nr:M14 family metallopeptidase [Thermoanaerobaculia bacterium]
MVRRYLLAALLPAFLSVNALYAGPIQSPSEFLGFEVGADRKLADYRQMVSYFRALDAASPRIEIEDLGKTTLGEPMIMAVISSRENIENKARLKAIAKQLADPRGVSDDQVRQLVEEGRTIVLVTCNIHSTEIAASQMAMEWAHALVSAEDAETKRRLDNVVVLLVPSLNPDGQIIVTDWYRKNVGTSFEGGRLPWLYHPYVGHDNNRDWYMLTQKETRSLSRAIYHEWFPQLFVDQHQMGAEGPRMFIPPFADPMDPDVHPLIWREANLIGTSMAFRLEQKEKSGLISGYSFDAYWLGGTRNTGWWKNITGLLLETASARIASPVYIDPTELEGGRKGLLEYKATVNHPNPWKGGWWRMRDIMDYQRIASDALVEIAADRRVDFLNNIVRRARAAVAAARPLEGYRVPFDQHDYPTARRLAALLAEHNVEVFETDRGDFWIPLAQPYGKFVVEMMEPQRYPEVKLMQGTEILQPYDVATWTLPLAMGVRTERVVLPALPSMKRYDPAKVQAVPALPAGDAFAVSMSSPESARVINKALTGGTVRIGRDATSGGEMYVLDAAAARAASAVAQTSGVRISPVDAAAGSPQLRAPRVAIYKPWSASMDEGWTRWLLEQYGFNTVSIENREFAAVPPGGKQDGSAGRIRSLRDRFDVIILPAIGKESIATGRNKVEDGGMRYAEELPADYRGGLGKDGASSLRSFVEAGGMLIAFAAATEYVMEEFNIPVRNALSKVKSEEFSVPGSLVRANVNRHPVTRGLPEEVPLFLDAKLAFETTSPGNEMQRTVLASYPADPRDLLLSGWIKGEEKLNRRAAAVALTYGKGKLVLLGFRPQHRAQTHVTFPFVFNSIYWSVQ